MHDPHPPPPPGNSRQKCACKSVTDKTWVSMVRESMRGGVRDWRCAVVGCDWCRVVSPGVAGAVLSLLVWTMLDRVESCVGAVIGRLHRALCVGRASGIYMAVKKVNCTCVPRSFSGEVSIIGELGGPDGLSPESASRPSLRVTKSLRLSAAREQAQSVSQPAHQSSEEPPGSAFRLRWSCPCPHGQSTG